MHGHRLYNCDKIFEYQITHNKNKKTKIVSEIKPKKKHKLLMDKSVPKCCYSTFFYKRTDHKNEIVCESYMCFEEDNNVILKVCEYFDPSDSSMCWVLKEPITKYIFCLGNSNAPISLERITFLDFYTQEQEKLRALVVQFNKKKYMVKLAEEEVELMDEYVVVRLEPTSDLLIRSLDEQEYEKGTILVKKPANYFDRGYHRTE